MEPFGRFLKKISTVLIAFLRTKSSKLMIVCASEPYLDSKNCQLELEYGFKKNLPMIPIKLDHASKLDDHIVLSSLIYVRKNKYTLGCRAV